MLDIDIFKIIFSYFNNIENIAIEKITAGSINQTYKLSINNEKFILQKINNQIFNENVMVDMINITTYLKQFILIPYLLKYDNSYYIKHNNFIYRIYKFIDGYNIDKTKISNSMLYKLGEYMYSYHSLLKNFDYNPCHIIKDFHNTQKYIDKINKLINNYTNHIKINVNKMINFYNNNYNQLFVDKQLIHGDTRIENILYNNNEFILIDYDTIMIGSIYIDIGDLCRSLFTNLEDNNIIYDKSLHLEFIKGYYNKNLNINYKDFEKKCIDSTLIISLELSIRFYIDYIEDYYFGYNEKKYNSRKDHNLRRANISYDLFNNIYKNNY